MSPRKQLRNRFNWGGSNKYSVSNKIKLLRGAQTQAYILTTKQCHYTPCLSVYRIFPTLGSTLSCLCVRSDFRLKSCNFLICFLGYETCLWWSNYYFISQVVPVTSLCMQHKLQTWLITANTTCEQWWTLVIFIDIFLSDRSS